MSARTIRPEAIELTQTLIARPSITPNDQGCQNLIAQILTPFGFERDDLSAGADSASVRNTWLRLGTRAPLLVLAGHTDVVPPGELQDWHTDPFQPTIEHDYLYGRGASDMKASVAAMTCALCAVAPRFNSQQHGSVALLLTSDEEGPGIDGTRLALEKLAQQQVHIDHCLIGEPTSVQRCGDTIKIGRRGSLSAQLRIFGKQGHIAYPGLAENPIHLVLENLRQLVQTPLDDGNDQFEPSSLQFSAINAGVASNVIPGQVDAEFNIRFCPVYSAQSLREKIDQLLKQTGLRYQINWKENPSEPFQSRKRDLANRLSGIITDQCGQAPTHSTSGGTSDGRFISNYCEDLVEFGPCNDTIHQANERVGLAEIGFLERVYTEVIAQTIGPISL